MAQAPQGIIDYVQDNIGGPNDLLFILKAAQSSYSILGKDVSIFGLIL